MKRRIMKSNFSKRKKHKQKIVKKSAQSRHLFWIKNIEVMPTLTGAQ